MKTIAVITGTNDFISSVMLFNVEENTPHYTINSALHFASLISKTKSVSIRTIDKSIEELMLNHSWNMVGADELIDYKDKFLKSGNL